MLTTLLAGTDSQAYCYDEQNRLVWASSGNGPCGAANSGQDGGDGHTYRLRQDFTADWLMERDGARTERDLASEKEYLAVLATQFGVTI
ncbi:MAG TPA: hypothetical protein VF808_10990 [Ktedonobacterales bacterium]